MTAEKNDGSIWKDRKIEKQRWRERLRDRKRKKEGSE